MRNRRLINFIVEARRRGFSDAEIKSPLLKQGWPEKIIDEAFHQIRHKNQGRYKMQIFLDRDVLLAIEKRAKKNMLSPEEQVEDIVRRSAVSYKKIKSQEQKIDDLLVSIFSRRRYVKS